MKKSHGFTLVELLVVVAIIVVLIALLLPSLDKSITQAERAVCASRQKGMSTVYSLYAVENKYMLPMGGPAGTNEGSWLHDMSFAQARLLFKHGAGGESANGLFYCPSEKGLLPKYWLNGSWSNGAGITVVGWVFFVDRVAGWPTNNTGYNFLNGDRAYRKISDRHANGKSTPLLADRQLLVDGVWVGWAGGDGYPNHMADTESPTGLIEPAGGNLNYLDGHVDWRSFDQMDWNLAANNIQYWW